MLWILAADAASGSGGMFSLLVPFAAIFLIMYLLFIRPQKGRITLDGVPLADHPEFALERHPLVMFLVVRMQRLTFLGPSLWDSV